MNLLRFIRKCRAGMYIIKAKARPGFSQVGEDIIVNYLFQLLKIKQPSYLDIGTNFPVQGNNTYFFYNTGCRGVCIEPDPELYAMIKATRPGDAVLNIGIGLNQENSANLYIFPHPYTGWNTFSEDEARNRELQTGIKIKEEKRLPLKTINEIIKDYFDPYPNFISIDVEGLDLDILKTLDLDKYKPEVICAETITFNVDIGEEKKISGIINYLETKGYFVFADTHVNTIFCRTDVYKKKH